LQLAIVLHDLKVGRDDVGGRENEAEAGEQEKERHKPFLGEQPKIEERLFNPELPQTKASVSNAPESKRPLTVTIVVPVEPVALVKPA
jgi:hypothetical protein